ncbi:hypothetical protein AH68_08090 [Bifidobacterium catenulatum PV20-2]|uniref:Uncharacterized protein n=1 Tax=Bifidobacterium catenulatum PV20-2 TaxID=1447716 RepID=A0A0A7I8D8_9BIFI|nr:hypothetical protein AH68_08090 [Bifidobacterium catenulatum PV20-2]
MRINFLFKLSCKTTLIGGGDLKVPFAIGIQCVNGEIRTTKTLMILRGIMASFLVGNQIQDTTGAIAPSLKIETK